MNCSSEKNMGGLSFISTPAVSPGPFQNLMPVIFSNLHHHSMSLGTTKILKSLSHEFAYVFRRCWRVMFPCFRIFVKVYVFVCVSTCAFFVWIKVLNFRP